MGGSINVSNENIVCPENNFHSGDQWPQMPKNLATPLT
jgi:hypothetical protein